MADRSLTGGTKTNTMGTRESPLRLSFARGEVGHEGVVALHGRAPHAVAGLDEAVHAREGRHVARPRTCRMEARIPVLYSVHS